MRTLVKVMKMEKTSTSKKEMNTPIREEGGMEKIPVQAMVFLCALIYVILGGLATVNRISYDREPSPGFFALTDAICEARRSYIV